MIILFSTKVKCKSFCVDVTFLLTHNSFLSVWFFRHRYRFRCPTVWEGLIFVLSNCYAWPLNRCRPCNLIMRNDCLIQSRWSHHRNWPSSILTFRNTHQELSCYYRAITSFLAKVFLDCKSLAKFIINFFDEFFTRI